MAEWLAPKCDQPIHSMRDHPAHYTALLGASWGSHMLRKNARGRWRKSWDKMLASSLAWAGRGQKGPDQLVLQQ